jgi:Flp pilus assembly protein TadB
MNRRDLSTSKFRMLEFVAEIIAWMQIVASPFLISLVVGAAIYFTNPTYTRLWLSLGIVFIGITIGIIWATKQYRRKGTVQYMSSLMNTPELDGEEKE